VLFGIIAVLFPFLSKCNVSAMLFQTLQVKSNNSDAE